MNAGQSRQTLERRRSRTVVQLSPRPCPSVPSAGSARDGTYARTHRGRGCLVIRRRRLSRWLSRHPVNGGVGRRRGRRQDPMATAGRRASCGLTTSTTGSAASMAAGTSPLSDCRHGVTMGTRPFGACRTGRGHGPCGRTPRGSPYRGALTAPPISTVGGAVGPGPGRGHHRLGHQWPGPSALQERTIAVTSLRLASP